MTRFSFLTDLHTVACLVALPYLLPSTTKKTTNPHRYLVGMSDVNTTTDEVPDYVRDRSQPFILLFGDLTNPTKVIVYADRTPVMACSSQGIVCRDKPALHFECGVFTSYCCIIRLY